MSHAQRKQIYTAAEQVRGETVVNKEWKRDNLPWDEFHVRIVDFHSGLLASKKSSNLKT